MPNFVKLDSKPFHPDTYVGPEQEDDDATQQQMDALKERSLSIKLEVENTVRWRWVKGEDGEDVSLYVTINIPDLRLSAAETVEQSDHSMVRWLAQSTARQRAV